MSELWGEKYSDADMAYIWWDNIGAHNILIYILIAPFRPLINLWLWIRYG